MDKFVSEVIAIQKRIRERIASEKHRRERSKDSYQCYLAYMKNRKLI
jgi:hypothetical protein